MKPAQQSFDFHPTSVGVPPPVGLPSGGRAAPPTPPVLEPADPHPPEIVVGPPPPGGPESESSLREARLRDLALRLKIDRPLAFVDLETTGTNPERDRILEIAVLMVWADGKVTRFRSLINPGIPIPPEATAIHGIDEGEVKEAPAFSEVAAQLARDLSGADLVGFNLRRFDLKMLAAELARAGVWFNPEEARVIDAMSIFHAMERRDLESAVRFYCARRHHGHRAEEDVLATIDVLHAQLARYQDLPGDVAGLDELCRARHPDWLTADGKIAWRDGAARITFGRHNGKSLNELAKSQPDYLHWLLDRDFPEDVKKIAEDALQGRFPEAPRKKTAVAG